MSKALQLKLTLVFSGLLVALVGQLLQMSAPVTPISAAPAPRPADCLPTCTVYLPIVVKPAGPLAATIEVNQALGQNSGRYVAGKDAGIIVYLQSGPVTVNAAQQSVVVKRDGNTITTLEPQPADQPTSVLVFLCPNRAACGDWQAGNYSFDVTVNGNTASLSNIQFQTRKPLRVLAVPMRVNYGAGPEDVPDDSWKMAGNFIQQVYPVDPAAFKWELGQTLDVSQFDIRTNEGAFGVWKALKDLQPRECTDNTAGANCFEKIIGFMPHQIDKGGGRFTNGYTYGDPANIVGIFAGMQRTVAHEVGHTFGLGDEYNGLGGAFRCAVNPTPPNYVGKDWDNRSNTNFSCVDSTTQGFEDTGSGVRVVASASHPLDLRGAGLLNDDKGNFMGNYNDVSKAWVSPDAWKQIFDQSVPTTPRVLLQPYRALEVAGTISRSGSVILEPWYSFTTTDALVPVSSTYTIKAVDALSNTLMSAGLEVITEVFDQELFNQDPLHEWTFNQIISFPVGTAAFKILSGTTVLKVVPISANAPVVTITAPTAGITITDNYTIMWNASDVDGDALTYDVEYNHSGDVDDWIFLATGITATQWMDDFSTLPGGLNLSRIRVTATDGIYATTATSGLFNVPATAPEAFILDPASDSVFTYTQAIVFEGYGYDYQDGDLESDTALVWTSNLVTGTLGMGPFIVVDTLPIGQHIITLSATNSLSMTAVTTVTITITPP
jgi:hypothetical protein